MRDETLFGTVQNPLQRFSELKQRYYEEMLGFAGMGFQKRNLDELKNELLRNIEHNVSDINLRWLAQNLQNQIELRNKLHSLAVEHPEWVTHDVTHTGHLHYIFFLQQVKDKVDSRLGEAGDLLSLHRDVATNRTEWKFTKRR